MGLTDLQHLTHSSQGRQTHFPYILSGLPRQQKKEAFACVSADLDCQGLSPCADPGGDSIRMGSCSTVGAVRKALHLWALLGDQFLTEDAAAWFC